MRGTRPLRLALGAVALVSVWGAAGGRPASTAPAKPKGPPIVVCQITAESGVDITLGQNDIPAVKAYVTWINAHGGVLGRPYKLVVENDSSSTSQAASLVRKCVTEDHASFILGPEETATMAAAIPVADSLHVVMITQGSGWDQGGVTSADVRSYSFPGLYDVFYLDDLDTATRLIAPRHLTRVAVIEDAVPGGLPNGRYMRYLCHRYHCSVVAVQNLQAGQTDDTPQVLNLLAAKPQIVVLGSVPGPDQITTIKAIRAQNPTIPISECSVCWTPGFVQAVGGPSVLHNVYTRGAVPDLLRYLPDTPANRPILSQIKTFESAVRAVGYGTTEDFDNLAPAWVQGQELTAAIQAARSTNEDAVMRALEHQHTETLDTFWARTPAHHGGLSKVVDVTETWNSSGQLVPVGKAGPEPMIGGVQLAHVGG
jgi:ABC-type branched-subunit amino acid transport system substrate-binding protein